MSYNIAEVNSGSAVQLKTIIALLSVVIAVACTYVRIISTVIFLINLLNSSPRTGSGW